MAKKLKNPPIFYALAQIRFNNLPKIGDHAVDMAENLRNKGFPENHDHDVTGVNVVNVNGIADVQQMKQRQWLINSFDKSEGYILTQGSIAFHTTKYSTSDDFLDKIHDGLKLLHEIAGLAFIDRIGMRYIDVINPKEAALETFLNPGLIGVSNYSGGLMEHSFAETQFKVGDANLKLKNLITNRGLALPPELMPLQLEPDINKIPKGDNRIAILDTDYSIEKRQGDIDLAKIKEQLKTGSDVLSDIFREAVTPDALKEWDK